ncbi:MAG: YifB family Mg chelatase-like AAA ATPase [Proteobacteria bacterium]|nr:YifB family Mg chelatase-like AAA ATPase [Pseudomonadota bacterium]
MPTERVFGGQVASPGLALGPIDLHTFDLASPGKIAKPGAAGTPAQERAALRDAVDAARTQLMSLAEKGDAMAGDILALQIALLEDPELTAPAIEAIEGGTPAVAAWRAALDAQIEIYRSDDSAYFRARAADLMDLRDRVVGLICGAGQGSKTEAPDAIYVAQDLTPSRFLETDWSRYRGAALIGGSASSHVAILARARGVPLLIGIDGAEEALRDGAEAILDAEDGRLIVDPAASTVARYRDRLAQRKDEAEREAAFLDGSAVTAGGARIQVCINVDDLEVLDRVKPEHCDGIGLTRSEFLFYGSDGLPDEDRQYDAYVRLIDWAGGKPVTVRTLDAGGDKPIPGLTPEGEPNPFLGQRAIRYCLNHPELFKTQLRALLRASAYGRARIMFPLVTSVREITEAKQLLDEAGFPGDENGQNRFSLEVYQTSLPGLPETIEVAQTLSQAFQDIGIDAKLVTVEFARKEGFKRIFVPKDNAQEASIIKDIEIIPVGHLKEAILYLNKDLCALPIKLNVVQMDVTATIDMAMIKGQTRAKRAMEIAAAGGHNILMNGSPGAGKTLMAKALVGILPDMSQEEMLEVTKIYSVAGQLPKSQPLITKRPFRRIHHTASAVSIVGGGSNPMPGEITLAHRGVLFLDEVAEFPRQVLEVLRQPLEDGQITISRARGSVTYPSQFCLVAAMNPCPCGYFGVEKYKGRCTCLMWKVKNYHQKLSGPFLDRIDIHLKIEPVDHAALIRSTVGAENSAKIRERVNKAYKKQTERFRNFKLTRNAEMSTAQIEKFCELNTEGKTLLHDAIDYLQFSARGYYRAIRMARTIADLDGYDSIHEKHISEALQYLYKKKF